jgi:hypothetical protein
VFLVQCSDAPLVRLATTIVLSAARGGQMKRSEQVSLAFMGVAAFAATFASATLYTAKPATSQSAQSCTTRPDGTQNCERRISSTYFFHGWWGSGSAGPTKTQGAALVSDARGSTSATSAGTVRGGFGSTGSSTSFRASAGG